MATVMYRTVAKKPNKYWQQKSNLQLHIDKVGHKLKIHTLDEWYNNSYNTVSNAGGTAVLNSYVQQLHTIKDELVLIYCQERVVLSIPS
jgi:hypothetical protein